MKNASARGKNAAMWHNSILLTQFCDLLLANVLAYRDLYSDGVWPMRCLKHRLKYFGSEKPHW